MSRRFRPTMNVRGPGWVSQTPTVWQVGAPPWWSQSPQTACDVPVTITRPGDAGSP